MDYLFGNALAGSHDGDGRDGFVSREKNDVCTAGRGCRDEDFGGEDVVGDGGEGLLLDEGDMLVGGGMKDEVRLMERKNFVEESAIGDAAQIEGRAWRWRAVCEVALEIEKTVFRRFEENEVRSV